MTIEQEPEALTEQGPTPAPLRRRLGIGGFYIGVALSIFIPFFVGMIPWVWWQTRRDKQSGEPRPADPQAGTVWDASDHPRIQAFTHLTRGWSVTDRPGHIIYRNRRSLAERVVGLRTVDAATGGPVSLSSALKREGFRVARGFVWVRIGRRVSAKTKQKLERAELEAKAELGDAPYDPSQLMRLRQQKYVEQGGWAWFPYAPPLLQLSIELAAIPFNRRRQRMSQLIAGTMVIRDPAD